MSMSTHVVGFREPDERWYQMVQVAVPPEVNDFFDGAAPDPAGVEIDLLNGYRGAVKVAREWAADMSEGVEITLADLPPNITKIRFYNSW